MFRRLFLTAGLLIVTVSALSAQQGQVLKYLSRHTQLPAAVDAGATEVVAYDASSKRAIISDANANRITFVDLANPSAPQKLFDVILNAYNGTPNSVAVHNGLVAVALQDAFPQNPGKVLLFDINGAFLALVGVGAGPDMLTFTPDGKKIIVCNEGEPSADYTIDPPGSVSIIDVTTPTSPVSQTIFFHGLNGKIDSLRALGVRIFGPNATVGTDLEPEYAAVSADGRTAFVTLQENNAIAIIDIATASLTRVVPLGYKDHLRGEASLRTYTWSDLPNMGTTAKGQDIKIGGFSGLWFEGVDPLDPNTLIFLTHAGRGPVGAPTTIAGEVRRPYVLPNAQAEVIRFSLNRTTGAFTVLNRIGLYRGANTPITHRPNMAAAAQGIAFTDEIPCDLNGDVVPFDAYGAQPGGIVVDALGTWWIVDRYRPSIYNVKATGELVARYVPQGTAAAVGAAAGAYGNEALPRVYAQRRANRGFDAVAIDGDVIYCFVQSPLDNPDLPNDNTALQSGWTRILAFNTITKQVVGEYLYPLFEKDRGVDRVTDAVRMAPGRFMVLETDDRSGDRAYKYLYDMDLKGATNLVTNPPTLAPGETLEDLTFAQLIAKGVKPVHKTKSTFLSGTGYSGGAAVRALARVDDRTLAVINDNGHGVISEPLAVPPTGTVRFDDAAQPILGILTYQGNGLDASDVDGSINIANWPVMGMYQPDAIATAELGGQTYLLLANEGDGRSVSAYDEVTTVAGVVVDPSLLLQFPTLQDPTKAGRLTITRSMGDLDGDGDYDRLYAFGGRSFSILNVDGNRIYDSGRDLEQRTATLYPNFFNASSTNNTFDSRSDDKGPEPESMITATINGRTYAFIALERIGHTFMYDVTDPRQPSYVDYLNTRDFTRAVNTANVTNGTLGDVGPETQVFVPHASSGNNGALLLSGNEVSGTMSVYAVRVPEIVSAPPATMNLCINDDLILRVQARGSNLTYQWARNGVDIPLAISSTYAVQVTGQAQAGTYTCRIREDGGMTITTQPTVVKVYVRTEITSQPKPLTQVDANAVVRLGIEATDMSDETFQWYRNGVMLPENATFIGTQTDTLTIRWLQMADTSGHYYCVVSGGCNTVRSSDAAVYIPEIKITMEPVDQILCPGDTAVFKVAAHPSGGDTMLTYQWRFYQGGEIVDDGRITGAMTPELTIREADEQDVGHYICLIKGSPSKLPRISKVVRLVIAEDPIIREQPNEILGRDTAAICDDDFVGLVVIVDGVNLQYQWLRNGGPVVGATDPGFRATQAGDYTCRILGSCSETVVETEKVTVLKSVRPAVGIDVPTEIKARLGDAFNISFTLREGSPTLRYQWYRNSFPIPGATTARYSVNSAVRRDGGDYICEITNDCGVTVTGVCRVIIDDPSSVEEGRASHFAVTIDPQPTLSTSTVTFTLPQEGHVRMDLLNVEGRIAMHVHDGPLEAGAHTTSIDAVKVASSGLHVLRLEHNGLVDLIPVVIVK